MRSLLQRPQKSVCSKLFCTGNNWHIRLMMIVRKEFCGGNSYLFSHDQQGGKPQCTNQDRRASTAKTKPRHLAVPPYVPTNSEISLHQIDLPGWLAGARCGIMVHNSTEKSCECARLRARCLPFWLRTKTTTAKRSCKNARELRQEIDLS